MSSGKTPKRDPKSYLAFPSLQKHIHMVNIFENLLDIKGSNKEKNVKQLSTCYVKFLKDSFLKNYVESICNVHYNSTQLEWTFKVIQYCVPHHITPLLTIILNWWSDKWRKKHHETTNIKPCSIVNIRFYPSQWIECFRKAWPRPKAYQCQETPAMDLEIQH